GKPLPPADLAPPPAPAGPVALDAAQFAPHTDSSSVMLQGKAVGYTVSDVRRSRDSLLYAERSSLGSGTFDQPTTVLLDPADGSVRPVDAGTFQPYRIAVTGSRVQFTMYVTAETARRVVKTEFVGQPFIVELVK